MSTDLLTLPANMDAEMCVLGSAMIDPDFCVELPELLFADDFFNERNRAIYESICALQVSGQPVDTFTLDDQLRIDGGISIVGDSSYIIDLVNATPSSLHADSYVQAVKRASYCRQAIRFATSVVEKSTEQLSPDELFAHINEAMTLLEPHRTRDDSALQTWTESFPSYRELLAYRLEQTQNGGSAFRYPWHSWNRLIDPAEPGLPILLASDTGGGKTTWLECLADYWAMNGMHVVFAHFELNRGVMYDRRMVRHSGIDRRTLKTGRLDENQYKWVIATEERMSAWPGEIHYLHTPGWDIYRLSREVESLYRRGMCDCLILDYLDKLDASPSQMKKFGQNIQRRLADDVDQWKNLAERLGIVTVSAAQLRKSGKSVSFNDMTKEDIAETGERVNKTNVVMLIHREILTQNQADEDGNIVARMGQRSVNAKIKLVKNTMGETGVINQIVKPSRFSVVDDPKERLK